MTLTIKPIDPINLLITLEEGNPAQVTGTLLVTPGVGFMTGALFVSTTYKESSPAYLRVFGEEYYISGALGPGVTGQWAPGPWTSPEGVKLDLSFHMTTADGQAVASKHARRHLLYVLADAIPELLRRYPGFLPAAARRARVEALERELEAVIDIERVIEESRVLARKRVDEVRAKLDAAREEA